MVAAARADDDESKASSSSSSSADEKFQKKAVAAAAAAVLAFSSAEGAVADGYDDYLASLQAEGAAPSAVVVEKAPAATTSDTPRETVAAEAMSDVKAAPEAPEAQLQAPPAMPKQQKQVDKEYERAMARARAPKKEKFETRGEKVKREKKAKGAPSPAKERP